MRYGVDFHLGVGAIVSDMRDLEECMIFGGWIRE